MHNAAVTWLEGKGCSLPALMRLANTKSRMAELAAGIGASQRWTMHAGFLPGKSQEPFLSLSYREQGN